MSIIWWCFLLYVCACAYVCIYVRLLCNSVSVRFMPVAMLRVSIHMCIVWWCCVKKYVNMCVCTYMDACCLECCCCCLSMSVYVHVYIYICVASVYRSFACVVILLLYFSVSYAYTGACMCTTYIYIYITIYTYMVVYLCLDICVYIYMCVCIFTCVCIYKTIYIYILRHPFARSFIHSSAHSYIDQLTH